MVTSSFGQQGDVVATLGEGTIDTGALRLLTTTLGDGSAGYVPLVDATSPALPDRRPGESIAHTPRVPVGPRAVILDCGTSRYGGYTHVLWIAPDAESRMGSHVFDMLGLILGRVYGVEAFAWEGSERLHVRAPGLSWDDLLREAHDALACYLAAR